MAYRCDPAGDGEGLDLGHIERAEFKSADAPFTCLMFVNPSGFSHDQGMLFGRMDGDDVNGRWFQARLTSGAAPQSVEVLTSDFNSQITGAASLQTGTWYLVAVSVADDASFTVTLWTYQLDGTQIDGGLTATPGGWANNDDTQEDTLGRRSDAAGDPLDGDIAYCAYVEQVLTQAEVESYLADPDAFMAGFPDADTVFYHDLEDTTDDGPNGHDVTLLGTPTQVAGPTFDTTAPTLTSPTASDTGETTADGSVDTDEGAGTLYWVVTQSATKPTVGQIQAGENHIGQPADDSASQAVSATGTQNVAATGLTEATKYWFHYQQEDAVGNDSTVVSASFTTHVALGLSTFVLSPGVVTVDTGSLEVRVAFPAADFASGELPLSGLEYAVWPQASANTAQLPSAWGAPSLQGSDGEIDAGREFALEVTGTFSEGDVVYLYLSDSDGTLAEFDHFGGPVTVGLA